MGRRLGVPRNRSEERAQIRGTTRGSRRPPYNFSSLTLVELVSTHILCVVRMNGL